MSLFNKYYAITYKTEKGIFIYRSIVFYRTQFLCVNLMLYHTYTLNHGIITSMVVYYRYRFPLCNNNNTCTVYDHTTQCVNLDIQ